MFPFKSIMPIFRDEAFVISIGGNEPGKDQGLDKEDDGENIKLRTLKGDFDVVKGRPVDDVENGVEKTNAQNQKGQRHGLQSLLRQGLLRRNDQCQGGEKKNIGIGEQIDRPVLPKARGLVAGNKGEPVEVVGYNHKNQQPRGRPQQMPPLVDRISFRATHIEGGEKDHVDDGEDEEIISIANPRYGGGGLNQHLVLQRAGT